ncbi:serine protease [Pseudomonas sp. NFACC42-2]|uniref:S1 family peptidase n=1 Tax=Pseudomonas sp. NFACC42-2 TaxID=1566193 RepID=UPI0008ECDBEB|nr:serine protease [Pseudomonas sp. NFACC42-2]SFS24135.1 Trypsin-like peptidase domain-containing protein [Pseudomonas sp. NFACC42-2]
MSDKLRALYQEFSVAMAYVAIEQPDGTEGIGSAFHVGDGVFVTARHVVDGNKILDIATVTRSYIPLSGEDAEKSDVTVISGKTQFKAHSITPSTLTITKGPFFHEDKDIDIAIFKVSGLDPYTPAIPLGDHLDDWLGIDDFVLTEVLVLGFPPVPFARQPTLIGARGEVNALMDLRHSRHVHFIVSAMPRGGFSGGVVITSDGIALGVITQSLVMNSLPEQLGYMAVLSVEPIYSCLAQHKLLPAAQDEIWDGFWNANISWHAKPKSNEDHERLSITTLDDGRNLLFSVFATSMPDRKEVLQLVKQCENLKIVSEEDNQGKYTFSFEPTENSSQALEKLADDALTLITSLEYVDQNEYLLANSKDLPF